MFEKLFAKDVPAQINSSTPLSTAPSRPVSCTDPPTKLPIASLETFGVFVILRSRFRPLTVEFDLPAL
jgi:hypothetical protein